MNILTFDIEEWFIYRLYPKGGPVYFLPILDTLLDELLDLLDRESAKATFFCLGIIAREYPYVIKKIASRGHEIGCHSDKHIPLIKLGTRGFEDDLKIALSSLEEVLGAKITTFRAPAFSVNDDTKWAFQVLVNNGIKNDCSVFPANRADGGYSDFKFSHPVNLKTASGILLELPININRIFKIKIPFSGGGYFRLLPYPVIRRMMEKNDYVMSYFHLRDFDKKQKEVISSSYFKSYYGIRRMLSKFERFLKDHEFVTVNEAAKVLEKSNINEIIV